LPIAGLFRLKMIFVKHMKNCITDLMLIYRRELGQRTWPLHSSNGDKDLNVDGNRWVEMQKKELSQIHMFGIALVAFMFSFLHGWIQLIVKARVFFLMAFFESCVISALLLVNPWKPRKISIYHVTGFIRQKSLLVLAALQNLIVIWIGIYVKDSAVNANRADIYELFLVLSVPSVIICMHFLNNFNTRATESIIFVISGIKILTLCRDPIFLPHTLATISCLFISAAHGVVLAIAYAQLHTEHVITFILQLTVWKIPLEFLMAIFYGEDIHQLWSVKEVLILFIMAILTLAKMASILLLMKYSSPLCCIVTTNLSWIPLVLVRAFIFKFLFLISSFKLLFLFILDLFFLLFKEDLDRLFDSLKLSSSGEEYTVSRK